jgi:ubiquinol-cytochrome c reductase cytochrome c1 subunit
VRVAAVALLLGLLGLTGVALAQGEETSLEPANTNIKNVASLQRGAKYYVNYCLGCHSAKYVRYNRLAADLGITEKQLVDNLMFTGEHPFDTMAIAMKPEDATRWFGVAPPDLSLIARSRGTDYLYTYLRGFYLDPSRPTGVNNVVLRGSAMPAVLWELQGPQRAKFGTDATGKETFEGFEQIRAGQLPPARARVARHPCDRVFARVLADRLSLEEGNLEGRSLVLRIDRLARRQGDS